MSKRFTYFLVFIFALNRFFVSCLKLVVQLGDLQHAL